MNVVVIRGYDKVEYFPEENILTIRDYRGVSKFFLPNIVYARRLFEKGKSVVGVVSISGTSAAVLTRYDIWKIIDMTKYVLSTEMEKDISEKPELFVDIEFRKTEEISSSAAYLMHNGPFNHNGTAASRGKGQNGSGDPHFVWPKFRDPWIYNIEENNILIKRISGTGFHEYYGDVVVTLLNKLGSDNSKTCLWQVEKDPYVEEKTDSLTEADPKDLSKVEFVHLKSLLKNTSNNYGIKYQRLCKLATYYIVNAPFGVVADCMNIDNLDFDNFSINANWFDGLKEHIKIFELDAEKTRKVFEIIVTIMIVFAHKAKKLKEFSYNWGWIMRGFMFEVIDIFDRADI